jgi:hypothetical protein
MFDEVYVRQEIGKELAQILPKKAMEIAGERFTERMFQLFERLLADARKQKILCSVCTFTHGFGDGECPCGCHTADRWIEPCLHCQGQQCQGKRWELKENQNAVLGS